MADLRKLKDRATELISKGKLGKAVETYQEILAADPGDVSMRQKLAEAFRRAGQQAEAVSAYRQVADRYARDGLLIKAIAICKIILEIDSDHVETQTELARLYARRRETAATSSHAAEGFRPTAVELPVEEASADLSDGGEVASSPPQPAQHHGEPAFAPQLTGSTEPEEVPSAILVTPYEAILSVAAEAVSVSGAEIVVEGEPIEDLVPQEWEDEPLPAPPGVSLPVTVPLFSDLGPGAFVGITEGSVLRNFASGDTIIREGEAGSSFFVVVAGRVRVEKRADYGDPVLLAYLEEGAFFGEMALLSGAPRAAAVIAEEETQALEITADLLANLCREHPSVASSLTRFYRQRLLANVMAASPLFRPFDKAHRRELMRHFRNRAMKPGEKILHEGLPSDGLYVILSGAVEIRKKGPDGEVLAGKLCEGDVFGEMSCLGKTPASATVIARRGGMLLRLPRVDFDEIVTEYPQVLALVAELADERELSLDAILSGRAEFTEDGLVLL